MINQLFRTKFESNLTAFIVFLFLNALAGIFLITGHNDSRDRPLSSDFYTFFTIWLLSFCLVAGAISLLRYNKERSSRLYAQLPVSPVQVRLAYWFHASLYLCISSLMLLLVLFYADKPLIDILLFTLLYLSHAGVLLAVISILTSNTLRLIPEEVRKRTVIYFFLAAFVTCLFIVAIGFIVAAYIHVLEGRLVSIYGLEGRLVSWPLLTLLMVLLCTVLVSLDIQLFRKKDNYLG